jgi:DNA-binding response OmpR family regulator
VVVTKVQRILLVEDEADIRAALAILLADEGYEVLAAPDGFDGLASLDGIAPDVIILDWRMPVIDGGRFIRALRDEWKLHTPVLVITAGRASREEALSAGADDFLAKPFDLEDLLAKVRTLAARARDR